MSALISPEAAAERYEHGTRARYMLGRCRCAECQFANCEYENTRNAAMRKTWRVRHVGGDYYIVCSVLTGEIVFRTKVKKTAMRRRDRLNAGEPVREAPSTLVDTAEAVSHIRALRRQGIGYKTIAAAAGIARGVLLRIISGDIRSTRRAAADRILAVSSSIRAPGAKVDAKATWVLIDRMIAAGFTKGRIARALGSKHPALQLRRDTVLASTHRRVAQLYEAAWQHSSRLQELDPRERPPLTNEPQAIPLSKRDPAIARRWAELSFA